MRQLRVDIYNSPRAASLIGQSIGLELANLCT